MAFIASLGLLHLQILSLEAVLLKGGRSLTSQPQKAGFPLTLELETKQLPKRSWFKISQIRALDVERLGKNLGRVTPEELLLVLEGLNEIIGD